MAALREKIPPRHASLRGRGPTTFSSNSLTVDEAAGIIYNASAMSIGGTKGHGFDIDAITLQQLLPFINDSPVGLKSRFTHPEADEDGVEDDDIGTTIGRVRNARIDGDQVKVDIHLAAYADLLPTLPGVRKFLLAKAKEDPTSFGLSTVIGYEVEPQFNANGEIVALPARLFNCSAVDCVGTPAANPNGLLSAREPTPQKIKLSRVVTAAVSAALSAAGWEDDAPANPPGDPNLALEGPETTAGVLPGVAPDSLSKGVLAMDEFMKSALRSMGANPDATDADLSAYFSKMSSADQAKCKAMAAKLKAGGKLTAEELPSDEAHKEESVTEPTAAAQEGDYLDGDETDEADDGDGCDLDADTAKMIGHAAGHAVRAYKGLRSRARGNPAPAEQRPAPRRQATLRSLPRQERQPADPDELIVIAERKRTAHLRALGTTIGVPDDVVNEVIASGVAVKDGRVKMLEAARRDPIRPAIGVGLDNRVAALAAAIPQAIILRANPDIDLEHFGKFEARLAAENPRRNAGGRVHELAPQFKHMTLCGMYREYLSALGCDHLPTSPHHLRDLMSRRELRRAYPKFAALAESTSDFSSLTLDAINKSLRFIYQDAPRTWNKWAQRGTNPDFKNIHRVAMSESPTLVKRQAGGEVQYVQLTDGGETFLLQEYGAGIRLTRQVIINDDLSAFSSIPRLQANAAARLEDDVAYAVLTLNAAMADGGNLFNTTAYSVNAKLVPNGGHQNQITGPYPVSVAGLNAAKSSMKKQKGPQGAARLELPMKYLLVPTSIEAVAEQAILSEKLIPLNNTAGQTNQGEANPFYKKLEVIGSTRLDDNNALNWYGVTDYRLGQVNTVEVCFLTDEPEPVAKQETDFDTDDVKYYVRHTVAAAALDFRGMVKVIGA